MKTKNLLIVLLTLTIIMAGASYYVVNSTTAGVQIWGILTGSTTDTDRTTTRGGRTGTNDGTRGQRTGTEGDTGGQQPDGQKSSGERTTDQNTTGDEAAVTIRPASTVVGEVGAAGNIALAAEQNVVLEASGIVREVAVKAGDQVQQGDLLLTLDSIDLERELMRAQLDVTTAQNDLDNVMTDVDEIDISLAEAQLVAARENLLIVAAGPSIEELTAARSNVAAAWAHYNELVSGPTEAQITQMQADLAKAEIDLKEAQYAYDQIAWRDDIGMTPQALALEKATIEYESAKAAFEVALATAPSDVQAATSAAQNAQHQLDLLEAMPSDADIATATAQVTEAEATLQKLLDGPDPAELTAAEIALENALIDLDEAQIAVDKTKVLSPMDGTVLDVHIAPGEQSSLGRLAFTMADPQDLELTINVAEVDMLGLAIGQQSEVTIDALPGVSFQGIVERIAPTSDPNSTIVAYPVTIQLINDDLTGVLPGMTAVASIQNTVASGSWLVPTSSIQQEGDTSVVTIIQSGGDSQTENTQLLTVPVIPGTVQGEWTVVESTQLQQGDQVMGSLASYIDEDEAVAFGPGSRGAGGNVFRSVTR